MAAQRQRHGAASRSPAAAVPVAAPTPAGSSGRAQARAKSKSGTSVRQPAVSDLAAEASASSDSDSDSDSDVDSAASSSSDADDDSETSSGSDDDLDPNRDLDLDALATAAAQSLTEQRDARVAAARAALDSQDVIGLGEPSAAEALNVGPSPGSGSGSAPNELRSGSKLGSGFGSGPEGPLTLPPPKDDEAQIKALAAQYTAAHPSLGETMAARAAHLHGADRTRLDTALPKKTAKKVRAAERAQTAGSRWFGMPAVMPQVAASSRSLTGPSATAIARGGDRSLMTKGGAAAVAGDARGATADEIRRELVAIRLRNAMDPKRFFRGHQKKLDIPPYAQIGTVIASASAPKQQLGRGERGRTVVDEVMRDTVTVAYAQKKAAQVRAIRAGSLHNARTKLTGSVPFFPIQMSSARTPQGRTKFRTKGQKKKSSSQRSQR